MLSVTTRSSSAVSVSAAGVAILIPVTSAVSLVSSGIPENSISNSFPHHKGIFVGFLKGQRGRYCPRTCASGSGGSRISRYFHSDDDIADHRAHVRTVEPQEIGGRSTILFQPSR